MATRMQQRRGTAAQWTSANPILSAGEIGFETDTGKFKIGNGSSTWSALNYYVDANAILDGAPGVLDTLNELAAALGDDPAFITTVGTNLSNHTNATTNVHGIANTANLATLDDVADAISNAEVNQAALAGTGIDWNAGTNQFDIDNTVVTLTGTQTLTNKTLTAADLGANSVAVTQSGTDNTTKLATTEFVQGRVNAVIGAAPELLNTLNELSAAIANDANFSTTITGLVGEKVAKSGDTMTGHLTLPVLPLNVDHAASKKYVDDTSSDAADGAVASHNALTTNVHGIGNVSELATKSYADNSSNTAALGEVGNHNALTQNVHGIADTSALATKTYADNAASTAANNAVETHRTDTTSVHGIANTEDLVLTNDARLSDTRTPTDNTVSTAKIINLNVTADKLAADSVTTAKIEDGAVTSAKIANGTIVDADINASAAIAQSKISGLTTDLAAKAPLASPTFTGTVSGITKSMVGLGNVDNTSDANKPVSTATQTALDLKANLASPTFTGTVTLPTGTVTSGMILDGTIVNADINASAAIALSKLATDPLARANHTGTQTASTISDFDTQVRTSKVTDLSAPTGSFSMNSQKITNLADPTADQDAATKAYVDAATAGLNVHASVKAATTANINLTNGVKNNDVLDGVTLATGNRILVKNQNTAADNGVYVVGAGAATRATDYDSTPEVDAGDFIFVEGGTVNGKTGWVQTNLISTIGTDAIAFTQFSGSGTYTAGTGLTLTGSTFSINTGTTVDLSTAQTLTNKTFVAPVLGAASATSINGTTIPSSKTLVTTADTGTVTSTMIADGTIVDADINASAAISQSKISGLTSDLAAKAPLASPTFTGTVTLPAAGIVFSDGTQSKEGVPSRTPIIQKTAAYTLGALTERDSLIEVSHTGASAVSVTIPADSTLNFPIGTSIDVLQTNTGSVAIAAGAGVTVNATPGLTLRTQWSSATLLKRAANTWVVYGDLK